MKRIKTGIQGLDRLIKGGIPRNHLVLISGQTGVGKSILSMQFLVNGANKYNERGLFISFEQEEKDIISQGDSFGWKLDELQKSGEIKILTFNLSKDHILDINKSLENAIKEFNPKRIVFDSISTYAVYAETISFFDVLMSFGLKKEELHLSPTPESVTRKAITEILGKLKALNATCFVISELPENTEYLSRDTISEFFCDGVILLYYSAIGGESFGTIQVRKMRNTEHLHDLFPTKIGKNGVEVEKDSSAMLLK